MSGADDSSPAEPQRRVSGSAAEDRRLFEAWRDGDQAAGKDLFARHYASVSRFFRNKIGEGHDDLVQRTFEVCVRRKDGIRDGERFLAYVLTVARHELYAHFSKRRRRGEDPLEVSIASMGTGPSSMVARNETQARIRDALRELPLPLQTVLELHYWEDLSTAELAAVLEVPQGTVKTRLRRARQLLQEALSTSSDEMERDLAALAR